MTTINEIEIRSLSDNEIDTVSGGVAPLVILGGAAVAGFGTGLGVAWWANN